MDRRNFLRTLIGGVAVAAAERTFPFRVFSFPSEIITPTFRPIYYSETIALQLEAMRKHIPVLYESDQALFKMVFLDRPYEIAGKRSRLPLLEL